VRVTVRSAPQSFRVLRAFGEPSGQPTRPQHGEFGRTPSPHHDSAVTIALTRAVSPSLARCELTHLAREPIDAARAAVQHAEYERCLAGLKVEVVRLPPEPDLPDSVFVEDAAVILDELAIITRPGAASRRPETAAAADALRPYRDLRFIVAPATVDGGDVLTVGRRVYVGLSSRTSASGVEQLRQILAPFGYHVTALAVNGCLHLKSAATQVAPDTLLINRDWVDARAFSGKRLVEIDPAEPRAANALMIGDVVIFPAAFPRTHDRLCDLGIKASPVDVSELSKAEGGVTCCSLVVST
jgi:dimethylargininase